MEPTPIVVPVRFAGGGLSMQTTTSRLTIEGAFIRCLLSPKEGAPVLLLFTLPDEPATPLEVQAVVAERVASGQGGRDVGFAVRFVSPGPIAHERIAAFLRSKGVAVPAPGRPAPRGPAAASTPASSPAASMPPASAPAPGTPADAEPAGSRRTWGRLPTRLQVGWASPREFLVAYSANLSRGGIFVSTPNPPPMDEVVELLLELPDSDVPASTQAQVVQRVTAEDAKRLGRVAGAGLQFVGGDDGFRARLDRCIEALTRG